jgi:hypothetical protein
MKTANAKKLFRRQHHYPFLQPIGSEQLIKRRRIIILQHCQAFQSFFFSHFFIVFSHNAQKNGCAFPVVKHHTKQALL